MKQTIKVINNLILQIINNVAPLQKFSEGYWIFSQ